MGHGDSRRKLSKKESEFGFKIIEFVVSVGYAGRDPNKQPNLSSKGRIWPGIGHSKYDICIPSKTSTGIYSYIQERRNGWADLHREKKKKQQNKKEINEIKNIQQKDIKLIIKMCTDY